MSESTKLDKGLRTLVERVAKVDPSFEVDLVVASSAPREAAPIADSIQALGGKVKKLKTDVLQCSLPVVKVLELANQEAVSSIRLTRMHRMHSKQD